MFVYIGIVRHYRSVYFHLMPKPSLSGWQVRTLFIWGTLLHILFVILYKVCNRFYELIRYR